MNFEFVNKDNNEKKIIITGGTEGIGRAITKELSSSNNVVICARNKEKIKNIEKDFNIKAVELDLAETEKIKDFADKSVKCLGGVDTVILNAAVAGIKESVDYTFRVNRDAPKELIKNIASYLRKSHGCIVLLTSSQAKNIIPELEHYGQSKKDIEDWLLNFSNQPENKDINIFFVNPGHVDTKMNQEAINYGPEVIKKRSLDVKDSGKFRDPEIIGKIISKMSLLGKKFNSVSGEYNIEIQKNETIVISDENILFELNNNKL